MSIKGVFRTLACLFVCMAAVTVTETFASPIMPGDICAGEAKASRGGFADNSSFDGELAGEAVADEAYEAEQTIYRIINPEEALSADKIADDEKSHSNALAVVTGALEEDGTIAGYKNIGIAKVDNWLNVRKEPKEDAEIIGKMPKHAGCEIEEEKDGWAYIRSGKVKGWSKLEYLYTGDEAIKKANEYVKYMATVTTTTLYVREEPTTESSVITMIPIEETLEIIEDCDGWVKITIDDEEGYISKEYITISKQLDKAVTISELKYGMGISDVRISMVNYAKQFLGNRYVWGGTSLTKGTDCSGYTMGIYRKFGISLPRVSRSQATVGTKVTVAQLKPGDLVFYGKGSYINHVAMYIGNGQVIHASSPKTGIKISNVSYRTPITCRRILKD